MTTPPDQVSFNAWHEPWIHVLTADGTRGMLSIKAVLSTAHAIHSLADSSPLTVGGTHRLLTAILQFIYQPEELADINDVLQQSHFDPAKLAAFDHEYAHRFELFHATEPFLQTGDVALDAVKPEASRAKGAKSTVETTTIAQLFADIPTATNRTHFHHVIDAAHRLCPACCLAGLVTFAAFAQNAGRGWRASINGDPPLYLIPVGQSLFEGLALSLMGAEHQPPNASHSRNTITPWTRAPDIPKEGILSHVGYIESLTFPARRVRLFPQAEVGGCTRCGHASAVGIRQMVWAMGLGRPKDNDMELWQDPFVAYYIGSDKKLKSRKATQGKALWREYSTLFLSETDHLPRLIHQLGQLINDGHLTTDHTLRFRCIGLRTDGKAKVFEWLDDALDVPPPLLNRPAGAHAVREALERASRCEKDVGNVFSQHVKQQKPNTKRKNELFKHIRLRMQDTFWAALAQPFRELVQHAGRQEELADLKIAWETRIIATGEQVLEAALSQRGDSAAMLQSRVEALNHYRGIMAHHRKEGW